MEESAQYEQSNRKVLYTYIHRLGSCLMTNSFSGFQFFRKIRILCRNKVLEKMIVLKIEMLRSYVALNLENIRICRREQGLSPVFVMSMM